LQGFDSAVVCVICYSRKNFCEKKHFLLFPISGLVRLQLFAPSTAWIHPFLGRCPPADYLSCQMRLPEGACLLYLRSMAFRASVAWIWKRQA
jgi:hypothetical protein